MPILSIYCSESSIKTHLRDLAIHVIMVTNPIRLHGWQNDSGCANDLYKHFSPLLK